MSGMHERFFLAQLKRIVRGCGIRRDLPVRSTDFRSSDGAVPTTTTSDNLHVVVTSGTLHARLKASAAAVALLVFQVPGDYDTTQNAGSADNSLGGDECVLTLLVSGGSTTRTLTPTVVVTRPGGSAPTVTAPAVVTISGATATEYEIKINAAALQPHDIITVTLTAENVAQAVDLYGGCFTIKSNVVKTDATKA